MRLWKLVNQEPVAFQALIQASLALAVSFGTALSSGQVGAILGFSAAALAVLTRSRVSPVVSLAPDLSAVTSSRASASPRAA